MAGEFELIGRFFKRPAERVDVLLGVGDDCALLAVPPGQQLAVSLDTLVAGRHFPDSTPPACLAAKAVAVNLSDLAAMGAQPAWMTLALTLPAYDEPWLTAFSASLFQSLDAVGVALVGGDTTRGPLCLTLQAHGFVEPGLALRRAAARPGELIVVSGTLGDAGLGLALALGQRQAAEPQRSYLLQRLNRPTARVGLGRALRGISRCAIDISDGLAQDLSHILAASGVGARLDLEALPLSAALRAEATMAEALPWALAAGDDYELCFTVPAAQASVLPELAAQSGVALTVVGQIEAEPGLRLRLHGQAYALERAGYQHFESP